MTLRIAFIGCVEFSHATLELVLTLPEVDVVGVVTRQSSPGNADFRSLEDLAKQTSIPTHIAKGDDQNTIAAFLHGVRPDVVYCFGWSNLLKREVLRIPPQGVVGYHPAALPRNRGRHPLIWALALGLEETASTFFMMDEGTDSGHIISQDPIAIAASDNAASLYDKMTQTALDQIARFTPAIASGTLVARPQNSTESNTWRRRTQKDGEIDWRMPGKAIHDLVRALARPYVGAHCVFDGKDVRVWRADLGPPTPANLEPGKVLDVINGEILVKCWDRSIRIVEHEFPHLPKPGEYL